MTVIALAFMAALYLSYAVLDVIDPSVGFAPVQGPPAFLVLGLLPAWSLRYARRVIRQAGPAKEHRQGWLGRPSIHLVGWWVPVANVVLPFVLLQAVIALDPDVRPRAGRLLCLWAAAWAAFNLMLWAGFGGLVDVTASAYSGCVALLAALAAGMGLVVVWQHRSRNPVATP